MLTKRMSNGVTEQMMQRAADSGAAGSAFLAGATWIADLNLYLQAGATIVAIVAGGAAAWYHIERARYMRHKNQEWDEDNE